MSDFKSKKKNGNYRCSTDIVRDILIVASVSVKKTWIMYQANLSYTLLNKYLNRLLKQDLVNRNGTSYYLISKKGLDFLKIYDEYVKKHTKLKEQIKQTAKDRMHLEKRCSGDDSNG